MYEFIFLTQEKANEENKDSNSSERKRPNPEPELVRKRPKSELGLTIEDNTIIDLESNYIALICK